MPPTLSIAWKSRVDHPEVLHAPSEEDLGLILGDHGLDHDVLHLARFDADRAVSAPPGELPAIDTKPDHLVGLSPAPTSCPHARAGRPAYAHLKHVNDADDWGPARVAGCCCGDWWPGDRP